MAMPGGALRLDLPLREQLAVIGAASAETAPLLYPAMPNVTSVLEVLHT